MPALLGRIRTELIPENTHRSRFLSCNHNISSLVIFCAPVAYPGLSTLVEFQLRVLVYLELVADAGELHLHVFELLEQSRAITAAVPLDTQSLKSEQTTIALAYVLYVRIMCRGR